nr:unnamed protein product [Callosobruchus chinensis]
METRDFYDFKSLFEGSSAPFMIRKNSESRNNFLISQCVHLQVRKDHPGKLFFKTNFGNDFQTVLLSRNIQKEIGRFPELPRIRESLRSIPTKKLEHLQNLLPYIPSVFHNFYKNLPHGDKENDDEETQPQVRSKREQQNLNLQEQKENKEGHAAVESRLKKTNKNVPADYVGVCLQLDEILRHINEWEFNKKVTTVIPKLYQGRVKISEYKFNHLQILKKTLDQDYHSFYDELPH